MSAIFPVIWGLRFFLKGQKATSFQCVMITFIATMNVPVMNIFRHDASFIRAYAEEVCLKHGRNGPRFKLKVWGEGPTPHP